MLNIKASIKKWKRSSRYESQDRFKVYLTLTCKVKHQGQTFVIIYTLWATIVLNMITFRQKMKEEFVLQAVSPPVIFFTDRSKAVLLLLILFVIYVFMSVMLSCLFNAALWSPAGKGLISWLSCMWCFLVFLSLSHVVSPTWLYGFLIFALFLTLSIFDLELLTLQPWSEPLLWSTHHKQLLW